MLSPDTPVRVTGGQVQGVVSDEKHRNCRGSRGIPFAAPPVGELRWRPPAAVVGWEGVRDASTSGAICPQWRGDSAVGEEDCLSLNVWAPRETTEPLPVMVWIHGGGYRLGSGSGPGLGWDTPRIEGRRPRHDQLPTERFRLPCTPGAVGRIAAECIGKLRCDGHGGCSRVGTGTTSRRSAEIPAGSRSLVNRRVAGQ